MPIFNDFQNDSKSISLLFRCKAAQMAQILVQLTILETTLSMLAKKQTDL